MWYLYYRYLKSFLNNLLSNLIITKFKHLIFLTFYFIWFSLPFHKRFLVYSWGLLDIKDFGLYLWCCWNCCSLHQGLHMPWRRLSFPKIPTLLTSLSCFLLFHTSHHCHWTRRELRQLFFWQVLQVLGLISRLVRAWYTWWFQCSGQSCYEVGSNWKLVLRSWDCQSQFVHLLLGFIPLLIWVHFQVRRFQHNNGQSYLAEPCTQSLTEADQFVNFCHHNQLSCLPIGAGDLWSLCLSSEYFFLFEWLPWAQCFSGIQVSRSSACIQRNYYQANLSETEVIAGGADFTAQAVDCVWGYPRARFCWPRHLQQEYMTSNREIYESVHLHVLPLDVWGQFRMRP